MIIKVMQTASPFKNRFNILVNDELKYYAGLPWMKYSVPLYVDRARSCVITDILDNVCFQASYDAVQNISNAILPIKWVFTGHQKSFLFHLLDAQGNACGKIYKLVQGALDTKYVIEYHNFVFVCYDISVGQTRHISIYQGDK